MKRFALLLALAAVPNQARASDWTLFGAAGAWQVRETDEFVRTLFEGEPDGFALSLGASRPVGHHHAALVASLEYMQGASVNGIRPGRVVGPGPPAGPFVVKESEWLRSAGLLVGIRLQGPPEWSVSPYLELLGGPTLVWQRVREARFGDAFTPLDRDEWEFTLQPVAGVEIRAGRATLAAEALWQHFAGDTTLAQPRAAYDLDRWAIRGRIGLRLGH